MEWGKPYMNDDRMVDFGSYERMMHDYMAQYGPEGHHGSDSDSHSDSHSDNDGGRIEIHMEERPDGSSEMHIIMESATKLAVTAGTAAVMALVAQ